MADTAYLKNYTTYRVTLTVSGTEYTQALSDRPSKVIVGSDDLTSQILFSFTSGSSGTGKRIFQGAEWSSPGFIWGAKTIYLQSPNAGAIAVIEEWTAP